MPEKEKEIEKSKRIKRLIHRSGYRGFKEVDLLLGGFAKAHAAELSEIEFAQFEDLLAEKDHDIFDWITGAQPTPSEFDTPLFAKLCSFTPDILK